MTQVPIRSALGWKAWVGVRFILFGVGGFLLMLLCGLMLLTYVLEPENRPHVLSPFLSLPLVLLGSLLMLLGSGGWGRWRYLWVFLSIPLSLSLLLVLPSSWDTKDAAVLLPALAAAISYGFVRWSYQRRNSSHSQ